MKVVYLVAQHIDKRNRERFRIDQLIESGLDISILDISRISIPSMAEEFYFKNIEINTDGIEIHVITNIWGLWKIYRCSRDAHYVIDFTLDTVFCNFSKLVCRLASAKIIAIRSGFLPEPVYTYATRDFTFKKISRFVSKILPSWIISRLVSSYTSPEILFLGGSPLQLSSKYLESVSKVVPFCSFDYDLYKYALRAQTKYVGLPKSYAVFLDENEVFHPDYKISGITCPTSRESYYTKLNSFFTKIETSFNLEVIIASHPRATYDEKDKINLFKGRTVIANDTAGLVKNCAFVLTHSSTSVSFAVLFRKPVVVATFSDYSNKPSRAASIKAMADALGQKVVDMSLDIENLSMSIEVDIYNNYINRYIKHPEYCGNPCVFERALKSHLAE